MNLLFNPRNLIVENTTDVISLHNMTFTNESYFSQTMRFIMESRKEYEDTSKVLYKSIIESAGNEEVIQEGFNDFFSKVKKIIDKFIEFIKSIFAKFITSLNSAIKSDKYIIKHKEDFKKFSDKNEFTFDGYEFTIYSNVPVINALESFNKEFMEIDFNELNNVEENNNRYKTIADTITAKYNDFINSLQNDWYDNFRARTIDANGPIMQSDFLNELFSTYRNGYSDKVNITVNNSYINEAYNRFDKYKSMQNDTKNIKEKIDKEYNAIKKQVEGMINRNYDKNPSAITAVIKGPDGEIPNFVLNNDILTKLDLFVKAKVGQVQEMSAIHGLAFSAKLDAISDCFRQDKTILYKALYKIQGTIKNENSIDSYESENKIISEYTADGYTDLDIISEAVSPKKLKTLSQVEKRLITAEANYEKAKKILDDWESLSKEQQKIEVNKKRTISALLFLFVPIIFMPSALLIYNKATKDLKLGIFKDPTIYYKEIESKYRIYLKELNDRKKELEKEGK